ncbi:MAG: carboxypeptidase regulatory-like domain-containing protein, partial [Planctomycetes bacterium]|nr:carboxypeptidase regulatory-like domain-containing protein [Planctomycetota bacterium]
TEALASTQELVERADLHNALVHAVSELNEPYRTVLLQRFLEELPPRAIAKRLGVPVNTVNTQLSRGLADLRERLNRRPGGRDSWMPGLALWAWKSSTPSHPIVGMLAMKMSTKLAAVAGVAMLGFGIWTVSTEKESDSVRDLNSVGAVELSSLEQTAQTTAAATLEHDRQQATRAPIHANSLSSQSPSASLSCIVTGSLEDVDGEPLPGILIQLGGYQGWADGVETSHLEGLTDRWGFEAVTDKAGFFRFEVPVPTVLSVVLHIEPDRFTDSHSVSFHATSRGSAPILASGLRDLGTIILARTGALKGRVVDELGTPVAGVKMGIGPSESLTYSRDTWTAEDGTYQIGHAPAGVYGVRANSAAHLFQYRNPIAVEEGRVTKGVDFVLALAPTIEGKVLSQSGVPIEGARVGGSPASALGGRSARTDTDEFGRFSLALISGGPHTISIKAVGFTSIGGRKNRGEPHEPGTRDLVIELTPVLGTQFQVVDSVTDRPIKNFGLKIHPGRGSKSGSIEPFQPSTPPNSRHEDGLAAEACLEGVDLFVVGAIGYQLASGDVRFDTPGRAVMTVRLVLKPAKSRRPRKIGDAHIAGRVLLPVGVNPGGLKVYLDDWRKGITTIVRSDGTFEFKDLRKGTHRLTLDGRPGILANLKAKKVKLLSGETQNVVLDASAHGMCRVSLKIDLGDLPVEGVQVNLIPDGPVAQGIRLGNCDATGRVSGSVRAFGMARVWVAQPGGFRMLHPSAELELLPGVGIEHSVKFESANLKIVLPTSVSLPRTGRIRIILESTERDSPKQLVDIRWMKGKLLGLGQPQTSVSGNQITVRALIPASYRVEVNLAESRILKPEELMEANGQPIHISGSVYSLDGPSYFSASSNIILKSGETYSLQLE